MRGNVYQVIDINSASVCPVEIAPARGAVLSELDFPVQRIQPGSKFLAGSSTVRNSIFDGRIAVRCGQALPATSPASGHPLLRRDDVPPFQPSTPCRASCEPSRTHAPRPGSRTTGPFTRPTCACANRFNDEQTSLTNGACQDGQLRFSRSKIRLHPTLQPYGRRFDEGI